VQSYKNIFIHKFSLYIFYLMSFTGITTSFLMGIHLFVSMRHSPCFYRKTIIITFPVYPYYDGYKQHKWKTKHILDNLHHPAPCFLFHTIHILFFVYNLTIFYSLVIKVLVHGSPSATIFSLTFSSIIKHCRESIMARLSNSNLS